MVVAILKSSQPARYTAMASNLSLSMPSDSEHDRRLAEHHQRLAEHISMADDWAIFRRFRSLSVNNILSLQRKLSSFETSREVLSEDDLDETLWRYRKAFRFLGRPLSFLASNNRARQTEHLRPTLRHTE